MEDLIFDYELLNKLKLKKKKKKNNNNNTKNNISIVNYTLTCFVDIDEILKLSPKKQVT